MTDERIQGLERLAAQHNEDIRGINAALNNITTNMQAFATAITELNAAQRITNENINRLTNTVEFLATEAAEDRATIKEIQAEVRQIWEYLMRQRGNGRSD